MLDTRTSTHAAPPSPIGELVEANSRLERRVGELLLVQDVAQSITSELRLDALLELAVTTVASLTSAHAVSILLVDPARGGLVERAQRGGVGAALCGRPRACGQPHRAAPTVLDGLSAWIARHEVPLLLRDVAAAGQFAALAGAEVSHLQFAHGRYVPIEDATPGGSFVGVPLVFEGRTLGVVCAAEKAGGLAFEERDLRLLVCLAPHLAIAIRNAELHAEARERAFAAARAPLPLGEGRARGARTGAAPSSGVPHPTLSRREREPARRALAAGAQGG